VQFRYATTGKFFLPPPQTFDASYAPGFDIPHCSLSELKEDKERSVEAAEKKTKDLHDLKERYGYFYLGLFA
jgi:hypothetical protein